MVAEGRKEGLAGIFRIGPKHRLSDRGFLIHPDEGDDEAGERDAAKEDPAGLRAREGIVEDEAAEEEGSEMDQHLHRRARID